MTTGILDTNVFIHAYMNDAHTAECRRFLSAVQQGAVQARLEPLVLHELSYMMPRHIPGTTRDGIISYFRAILGWAGIEGELGPIGEAITYWQHWPRIGFVDAFLAVKAQQFDCPVYTKNIRDFEHLGVETPDPLPAG